LPRRRPKIQEGVIALLARKGMASVWELAGALGVNENCVSMALTRLRQRGLVKRIRKGVYALKSLDEIEEELRRT